LSALHQPIPPKVLVLPKSRLIGLRGKKRMLFASSLSHWQKANSFSLGWLAESAETFWGWYNPLRRLSRA
jgi:hypothetical protein